MSVTAALSSSHDTVGLSYLLHRLNDLENCFYLQLYYWGRDVIHSQGNQLVAHGFQRIAKSSKEGTSRYQLPVGDGMIELHGWYMGWIRQNAPSFVFVRKRHRIFLWDTVEPARLPQFPDAHLRAPQSVRDWYDLAGMLQDFTSWILDYERWVMSIHGIDYRNEIYREYQKLPNAIRWMPPDVQKEWLELFAEDPFKTPKARSLFKQMKRRETAATRKACCPPFILPLASPSKPVRLVFA